MTCVNLAHVMEDRGIDRDVNVSIPTQTRSTEISEGLRVGGCDSGIDRDVNVRTPQLLTNLSA